MTEQEELWHKVRELLVKCDIMQPNGAPTEGNEKACKDFRKLILKDN